MGEAHQDGGAIALVLITRDGARMGRWGTYPPPPFVSVPLKGGAATGAKLNSSGQWEVSTTPGLSFLKEEPPAPTKPLVSARRYSLVRWFPEGAEAVYFEDER